MDTTTLTMIGIVTFGAIALYVLDRYSKQQEIVWSDAAKVGVAGSLLTGGIVFAIGGDGGAAVVDAVQKTIESDIFLGKPSF